MIKDKDWGRKKAAQHSGQIREKEYWVTPLPHFYNVQRCWEDRYHWVPSSINNLWEIQSIRKVLKTKQKLLQAKILIVFIEENSGWG